MSLAPSPDSVSTPAAAHIASAIERAGGWIGFDRYMALALYAPEVGYYARARRPFGALPASGSDFVTAPELTPLYGRTLARQVAQALEASGTREVLEFGAGSGALAAQLLEALGDAVERYAIVEVSAGLRERQRQCLARHATRVSWLDALPEAMHGVVVGNEVLDAMPVQLLHWDGERWLERGVAIDGTTRGFVFSDRPTVLRPPVEAGFVPGTTIELHAQGEAFVATLAERLARGAAFFIDYGFPAAEYYHPQRTGGTLMCHRAHRADPDPFANAGAKDITAHVDFTGVALAGQDAGLEVIGYTSQARFLLNCGLPDLLRDAAPRERAAAQKLLGEHEMGELFKVIGFATPGFAIDPIGFTEGDRTHRL